MFSTLPSMISLKDFPFQLARNSQLFVCDTVSFLILFVTAVNSPTITNYESFLNDYVHIISPFTDYFRLLSLFPKKADSRKVYELDCNMLFHFEKWLKKSQSNPTFFPLFGYIV
ncbi:hypothetical protein BDA99DRAFT_567769 [Phascolomyces articulosus]|uniref:Uncharacterized protein n=1 Tax=Phascolomyces articulosus TaxID=60185 RepID=A0AAD5KP79_9FUNG|nr:hypothetical protein BDA99DRAFT_567769 [Phascolomyces articulosus]